MIKEQKATTENWLSWGMLLGLFVYMFAINFMMPFHRDDYEYALIWETQQKIAAWPDVFQSLYNHYFMHGGRMVAFFVLDSFILLGKQWFNPFNAFLYVALMVLIYWHSQRQITLRFNPYILALILLFCWLGLPHFAEVNIWMTGSCVYLFTAVLIFTFLLPYNFHFWGKPLLGDNYMATVGMFFGGIMAGWTVENTAATTLLIVTGLTFYAYKKHCLTKWMVTGCLGTFIGIILLVVAPGNFVRYAGVKKKLIYHFTNQIAAGGEMLLYVLPVVLFLVLVWRIIVKAYTVKKGIDVSPQDHQKGISVSSMVQIAIIVIMIASYLYDSFIALWLGDLLYENVALKLGIADSGLKARIANIMFGFEEMIVYLLTIAQIYKYALKKLAIRASDMKGISSRFSRTEIMAAYPASYYAAALIALTIINNLAMIAAPTFPARATFGSVVFLIIGAMSLLTIPEVRSCLLSGVRPKYLMLFSAILFIPIAAATFDQHYVLYQENNQRMVYVEAMAKQGVTYLELEPLPLHNRVLRHIYFVELNNGVSKGGFCRYYGFKDVRVKEDNLKR